MKLMLVVDWKRTSLDKIGTKFASGEDAAPPQGVKMLGRWHDLASKKAWISLADALGTIVEPLLDGGAIRRDRPVDIKSVTADKGRAKERKSLNMVPVRVGKKEIGLDRHFGMSWNVTNFGKSVDCPSSPGSHACGRLTGAVTSPCTCTPTRICTMCRTTRSGWT